MKNRIKKPQAQSESYPSVPLYRCIDTAIQKESGSTEKH